MPVQRAATTEARSAHFTLEFLGRISSMRRKCVRCPIDLRFERSRTFGACERPSEMHRFMMAHQVETRLKFASTIGLVACKVSDLLVLIRDMSLQIAFLPANQHPALIAYPRHVRFVLRCR